MYSLIGKHPDICSALTTILTQSIEQALLLLMLFPLPLKLNKPVLHTKTANFAFKTTRPLDQNKL
jgi:hypothetical protein